MSSKEAPIFIIDDNEERSHKLNTILHFIGETCCLISYDKWKELPFDQLKVLIIGSCGSSDDSLGFFDELLSLAPDLSIILVDSSLPEKLYSTKNVLANLQFPFSYAQMLEALHLCQIAQEQIRDNFHSFQRTPLFRSLVGNSDSIRKVRKLIAQVAATEASVLIFGESGTGKEVVARNIHALSSREHKPFIAINCGAIPGELLESELFGHEKGAFTGAINTREGRFELADGGTLFLDEIGDMPLSMQVKLLRVLQEHCFERVGSNKKIDVNVRIIAATNRNLELAIREGQFREDLFYRLNVFPIDMPPLRERGDDLVLLIHELISRIEGEKRPSVRLMPEALSVLTRYRWPGNVRELANLVERLAILFPNGIVNVDELPRRFKIGHESMSRGKITASGEGINLKEHLVKTELALITQALEESGWVVAHAAAYLNMRRTTLVEKMRKYGLRRPERA